MLAAHSYLSSGTYNSHASLARYYIAHRLPKYGTIKIDL